MGGPHCSRLILLAAGVGLAVIVAPAAGVGRQEGWDPLRLLSGSQRAAVQSGSPVVDIVVSAGEDIGIVGAVPVEADAAHLVAASRRVEQMHGGRYVPLIRRFSSEPTLDDTAPLVLPEEDLEDLRTCRPGRCGVKLGDHEIARVTAAIGAAGREWRAAALHAYREVLVGRARAYMARGPGGLAPIHDQRGGRLPRQDLEATLEQFAGDPLWSERVRTYIRRYPRSAADAESFVYWSLDRLGDTRPIVSITHLTIFQARGSQPPLVAAVQVYASHYLLASVSLTTIAEAPGGGRYLLYSRRSRVDVFEGTFGALVRRVLHRRLRSEGPAALEELARRVSARVPPSGS